ncbi:MAG TPA: hypothetical protein VGL81_34455 [Polyangiaceae bacterium]|jgi:hypothetical protein
MRFGALALTVCLGTVALGGCGVLDPQTGPAEVACSDTDSDPSSPVSFAMQIRPLMNRSSTDPTGHGCIACHYSTQPVHVCTDLTGLDVATLGALRLGGMISGASIIIPGKPCESALVQKLEGDYFEGLPMPKDGPPYWSQDEIQLVIDWIAEGANGGDSE